MFAYCGNNPVNCSDPTGHSPLSQFAYAYCQGYGGKTYITDQDHLSIAEKRFGFATVSHGGCGAIATYNALISLGEYTPFDDVLAYYNQHMFQLNACGLAGTPTSLVAQYFTDSGYNTIVTDNPDAIDVLSQSADASILWVMFPATYKPFGIPIDAYGAHFIEYSKSPRGYIGHNTGGSGTRSFRWPSDYGYAGVQYYCIGIFVFE